MNKQQFQDKVKKLRGLGITIQDIADKIKFSKRSVERANQNGYKGDSSRVYWAFSKVFK